LILLREKVERATGVEPATSSLGIRVREQLREVFRPDLPAGGCAAQLIFDRDCIYGPSGKLKAHRGAEQGPVLIAVEVVDRAVFENFGNQRRRAVERHRDEALLGQVVVRRLPLAMLVAH
jgi:hypothetical protein